MNNQPIKPRFQGIRLPPEYENLLKETVEQDAREPEDENQPEVQNRLKRYGVPNVD
jgi:hypothetical protein